MPIRLLGAAGGSPGRAVPHSEAVRPPAPDGVLDHDEAVRASLAVPAIDQISAWSGAAPGPAGEVKERSLLPEPLDRLLAELQSKRFRVWLPHSLAWTTS